MLEKFDFIMATDGGSNIPMAIGKTGMAILDMAETQTIEQSRIYRKVTNNFTELKALAEALDLLREYRQTMPKNLKLLVVADSQYVIKSFTQWISNWSKVGQFNTWYSSTGVLLNQDLIKYIYYEYIEDFNISIKFLHTYGHIDHHKKAEVYKMQKYFEKQGYKFTEEETITILKLNDRADKLSSCKGIDKDGNPLK